MRKLEGFKNMDETIKNVQKENWQKELAQIEQRRNDRLPGHVNVVPPISEFGGRRSSPRERNRPGFTSRNCRRRRQDDGETIQDGAQNEVEFELETGELLACESRRGRNASQTANGCRVDPTVFQHICAQGAAQAWQQFASIRGERAPTTPVHQRYAPQGQPCRWQPATEEGRRRDG